MTNVISLHPGRRVSLDAAERTMLATDLKRLDALQPGLGAEALGYVLDGTPANFIAKLEPQQWAAADALGRFLSCNDWTAGRGDFLYGRAWQVDVVYRYACVLSLLHSGNGYVGHSRLIGTSHSPSWLRVLLYEYGRLKHARPETQDTLTIERLRQLLLHAGSALSSILDLAFSSRTTFAAGDQGFGSLLRMTDFDMHMKASASERAREIEQLAPDVIVQALLWLAEQRHTEDPYFALAFELALKAPVAVRQAAVTFLRTLDGNRLLKRVGDEFPKARAARRRALAELVPMIGVTGGLALIGNLSAGVEPETIVAEITREHSALAEPAKVDRGARDGGGGYTAADGSYVLCPAEPPPPDDVAIGREAMRLLRNAVTIHNKPMERRCPRRIAGIFPWEPLVADAAQRFSDHTDAGGGTPGDDDLRVLYRLREIPLRSERAAANLLRFGAHPEMSLQRLVRWAAWARSVDTIGERPSGLPFADPAYDPCAVAAKLNEKCDLRTYARICLDAGEQWDAIAIRYIYGGWTAAFDRLPARVVWPYFATCFEVIDEVLATPAHTQEARWREIGALRIISLFPKLPARYVQPLLARAIEGRGRSRLVARELLDALPGLAGILVPLLRHARYKTRVAAAEWLGDLQSMDALPALQAAGRVEAHRSVRVALQAAIARLNKTTETDLRVAGLSQDDLTGVTQGLEWLSFDTLPTLKLHDGTAVPLALVQRWVGMANKLGLPQGSPLLESCLDQLRPEDAGQLGQALLERFVAADTRGVSEEVFKLDNPDSRYFVPYVKHEGAPTDLRYAGSAIRHRGLLGLATRVPGPAAEAIARAYFRDHYQRTAQCRAIVECLASNRSEEAIRFVLRIAMRWRARSVQGRAIELTESIAQRCSWTAEQAADRLIPDGDFDADGILQLPTKDAYIAKLTDGLEVEVFAPDGSLLKTFPTEEHPPSQRRAGVSDATLALIVCRREAREAALSQPPRLYDAMCSGRAWPLEEWRYWLSCHPLMRRLMCRLLWRTSGKSGREWLHFTLARSGQLVGSDDAPVSLSPDEHVMISHRTSVHEEESLRWLAYFQRHGLEPLFNQLRRPPLSIQRQQADATLIDDCRGWLLKTSALRSIAAGIGYAPGLPSDDRFTTFERTFGSTGLTAIIEFTGTTLIKRNHACALLGLRFVESDRGASMPLGAVPPVVLSEAWNDLRDIAATGPGFAADWPRRTRA